ncbi:16S rRNA processing protein RimM [bacterium]|nr:16S rRNA processing protein RimM [bacterium]
MLIIGKALKAHGVRGDIKVDCYLDTPQKMLKLKQVFIDGKNYKIERTAQSGSFVLFKLDGIDTMEQAETLRNTLIMAKKEDLPPNEEGRYYIDDIIGCIVKSKAEILGKVVDIYQYGSADIYVVSSDKGQIMFPFVDGVIDNIDINNKEITVNESKFAEVAVYED